METTLLKKGSIRQLPVKEIRTENKRSYYIVIYGEKEYAISMFEFQKADPKPELLTCIVKEMNGQNPVFIQDLSPLYSRFYIEGNTYSFWVKRDCTDLANGYYELADWNGFYFKLQRYGDARLYEGPAHTMRGETAQCQPSLPGACAKKGDRTELSHIHCRRSVAQARSTRIRDAMGQTKIHEKPALQGIERSLLQQR